MNNVAQIYWDEFWQGDKKPTFFTSELQNHGLEFSKDMLLVCERFRLIDVKNK